MNKIVSILLLFALILTLLAGCGAKASQTVTAGESATAEIGETAAAEQAVPGIETEIAGVSKHGNIHLAVKPDTLTALGYEPADLVLVTLGEIALEMPVGTAYSDADSGEPIFVLKTDEEADGGEVILAINMGNLASFLKLAEIRSIDEDPGYEIRWAEGYGVGSPVSISMLQKQGYADEYRMHRFAGARTNKRSDYAALTDAEYANFREVSTSGMGRGTLFRSSSPVNPAFNRNKEADAMVEASLIRTVINLADNEETMKAYPDYAASAYAKLEIIALDMTVDLQSDDFKDKLATGLRFMATHEGPYLVHCNEGKDRAGFASALLECFMGASKEEVVADYMVTYYNYYGITAESEQYDWIAQSNICASLAKAFGLSSLDGDADLSGCATRYMKKIGLTDAEIAALRKNLSLDYGGIV